MGALNEALPRELAGLLDELARHGVALAVQDDGRLSVTGPRGGVPPQLLARVREHKEALLGALREGTRPAGTEALPTIVPDPAGRDQPFPLADLQTAFVMGEGDDMEYHVRPHYYLEQDGPALDPLRFERALNAALYRQRANLVLLGDDMRLRRLPRFEPVAVAVQDLRGLPADEQQRALAQTRATLARTTLPLDRWPWFQVQLSLYDGDRARLHWNHNNVFGDGYGTQRLMAEAMRRYHQPDLVLPEPALSYRDCVLALQRLEASALGEQSRRYWQQRLPGLPGPPPVPLRPGLNPRRRSLLQRRETLLDATRWSRLRDSAARHGVTPGSALFAVHAEVLARWSGSRHFLLNNMVTHRLPLHPEIDEVFGNFASLYPLEVDWREGGSFAQRAQRLQQQVARDLRHVYCSGVWVLQALNQARGTPGRAPCPYVVGSGLFMPSGEKTTFSCLETPQVVLDHQFWTLQDGRLWAVWDLIEDCFPAGLVDAMWQGYQRLLGRLADDPAAWEQASFDLLPPAQRERRAEANRTEAPLPDGLLHDGLARSAQRWPHKPAVVDGRRSMSYAQLHCHANRLAHALRGAGLIPGERVGIGLPKGWQQVVAVYGVLRAGGVYVPVDPAWPDQRRAQVLDSVQARHLVVAEGAAAPSVITPEIRMWRVEDADLGRWPGTTPPAVQRPDDLAYVLFTSGSTGAPKGVMVEHRAALNTVADISRRFGVCEHDVVFGISALGFDLSVYDLFGTLGVGGTLVLPADAEGPDPAAWLAAVRQHRVTLWNSVPALMQLLVEAAEADHARLPYLRTVMLSGDWIPVALPPRIAACAPQARLVSLGGATEAAIWSIAFPIVGVDPQWASIPYGRPLANQRWHVLHDDGQDAPDGVPGHLHIAGAGLARGYWGDDAKTAAAFVTHPHTGERLYRTGDLGCYHADGNIEFLGRSDFQLKVQGYRIEPAEIEQALRLHPEVREAVVLALDGPPGAATRGRRLAAFAVMKPGEPCSSEALDQHLRQHLPGYMVPGVIHGLDELPITPTGKLDRQALRRLAEAGTTADRVPVPPRSAQEACIAAVWQQVLGLPQVGLEDDFFELGGQSLAALRAVAEIGRQLGVRVPLSALLDGRSVAGLARRIGEGRAWTPLVALGAAAGAGGAGAESGADARAGNDAGASAGAAGVPWFLVHPSGGGVLCYRALGAALGGPVHGLEAPGLSGGQAIPDSIEALAALYLAAIHAQHGRGPFRLGGWSSGGLIAYEMARQMEQAGERVEHLILLDTPAPAALPEPPAAQLARWFDEDVGHGLPPAALQADTLQPVRAVHAAIVRAGRRYLTKGASVKVRVTLLRAAEGQLDEFAGHPHAGDEDWGWSRFVSGPLHCRRVPGTHHTLLQAQHLPQWIGDILR